MGQLKKTKKKNYFLALKKTFFRKSGFGQNWGVLPLTYVDISTVYISLQCFYVKVFFIYAVSKDI